MKKTGLYWWGYGRIWFMPTEKMEVITEEMAKRFFAAVEKRTGKSIRRTRDALEWVEMREYTFANGARILAFSNDEITDTTEIICRGGMDSLTAGREIPFSFAAYVI